MGTQANRAARSASPALTVPRLLIASSSVARVAPIACPSLTYVPWRFARKRMAVFAFACSAGVKSDERRVSLAGRGFVQTSRLLSTAMARA
jgi:hypothetical protein